MCACVCVRLCYDFLEVAWYLNAILCCRERVRTTSTGVYVDVPWTVWTGVTCSPWRTVSCPAACRVSASSPIETRTSRRRKIPSWPARRSPSPSSYVHFTQRPCSALSFWIKTLHQVYSMWYSTNLERCFILLSVTLKNTFYKHDNDFDHNP